MESNRRPHMNKSGITVQGWVAFALFLVVCLACLFLTGCRSFPNVEADHWTHDGHYGAFTTHYQADNIRRLPSGALKVETYTGTVTIMGGYGVSDTITGLVITPKEPLLTPIK